MVRSANSPSVSPACFPRATTIYGLIACICLMIQGLHPPIVLRRSLQSPGNEVEKSRLLLLQSGRFQDSGATPGKPWRDVQICKALFVWERRMGMILIAMFAIAMSKTIILRS